VLPAQLTERGDPIIEPSQIPLLEEPDRAGEETESDAARVEHPRAPAVQTEQSNV